MRQAATSRLSVLCRHLVPSRSWNSQTRELESRGRLDMAEEQRSSGALKVDEHYDIITIGSGGGAKVSTPANKLGFKVAMIEHGFVVRTTGEHKTGLGGTCLNRGCIPSKMLIHPADLATEISEAGKYFMTAKMTAIDIPALVARTSAAVDKDSASINPAYENNPTKHWYKATAEFVGPRTLRVDGGKIIDADHVFIACGAVPTVPNIPGLADTPYLTSTEALRYPVQPKKLIVLGGGYIAVELGHYFGALGTEVHMMVRSVLLRKSDREIRDEFGRVFSHRYNVHLGTTYDRVEYTPEAGFTLHYTQDGVQKSMQAEQILVAIGVTPATAALRLDKAGVELKEDGFIKVDDCLRTTAPNTYAFGDCAGNWLFRHSANFEGEYLLEHIIHALANKQPINPPPIDYTGMPHAVFSYPQVAGVGESEEELRARDVAYVKGRADYRNSAMGDARQSDHGFVKLLIEVPTRRILGCHIVGYEASTMIHQVIPLMRLAGKLDDLLLMIHIHPALNEILRNAARKARDALVAANVDIPLTLKLK